ncbi:MAG: V-type ATP synthase subunit A [Candidatus Latescibacteria bacterium]|nr:V-type ATP synthase subunit A [bacterium]MBD3422849.1 V-type ATP synthase subunit A [Candidatus Latescibacterota bacterium]
MASGKIEKVAGPLIVASGLTGAKMFEVARVSEEELIGEIIELHGDLAYIQVYEDTSGLGPGAAVTTTGKSLSIELGPGLLESIYDGIQRPLDTIYRESGHYISRGVSAPGLDRDREWEFKASPELQEGMEIGRGEILGTVQETELIEHRVMVPADLEKGTLRKVPSDGKYRVEDTIASIETEDGVQDVMMFHRWPVRTPRPIVRKIIPSSPLVTGQRVIDTFFPISKGGTATVPGPFGAGKTVVQHQLAKWSDADIIVYVGCGERGNEMTDVLQEFPELVDPATGQPLMKRTVLIANTSNMPVAAREASVYTGITIAEYFRDMGYSVAVLADSTSRWAEAMREMSGRLEEMPGEEGYPAYLPSRIAGFYERAGKGVCLGSDERRGSLSVIGAVSPPGGDLSDPVVQATLKVVKVFWALEDQLAFERHFPAIGWLTSYSLYHDTLREYFLDEVEDGWEEARTTAIELLQKEADLKELVRLVGVDSLSDNDRLILETSKAIREDFLHQSAFDPDDEYTRLSKQYLMLRTILDLHRLCSEAIEKGVELEKLLQLEVKQSIARMRHIGEDNLDEFEKIAEQMKSEINSHLSSAPGDELAGILDREVEKPEKKKDKKKSGKKRQEKPVKKDKEKGKPAEKKKQQKKKEKKPEDKNKE